MTNERIAPIPETTPAPPRQRITARALLEIKRPSDPKIHPDGRRVAFVLTEADFEESRMISHLWITEWQPSEVEDGEETEDAEEAAACDETARNEPEEAEGEEPGENEEPEDLTRQLTFSDEGEEAPKWSPDGRYLAFLSSRPDLTEPEPDDDDPVVDQVWILPIEGGEARKISNAREGVLDYAWLPDSSGILYLAPEARPKPVESVRKEARHRRKIDPVVEGEDKLRRQFWRVDVEGRKPKLLFTGDYGIREFALSPDGERLCWITNYTGEENDYHIADLFVVPLAAGEPFKLIDRAGRQISPALVAGRHADRVPLLAGPASFLFAGNSLLHRCTGNSACGGAACFCLSHRDRPGFRSRHHKL